jgi:hypothetical protein
MTPGERELARWLVRSALERWRRREETPNESDLETLPVTGD